MSQGAREPGSFPFAWTVDLRTATLFADEDVNSILFVHTLVDNDPFETYV